MKSATADTQPLVPLTAHGSWFAVILLISAWTCTAVWRRRRPRFRAP